MVKNNNIESLYKEALKYKLLTQAEEQCLFAQFKSGDVDARNLIINSNLRLVINEAKKKKNDSISMEDAVIEGVFGLNQAIDKFDHTKGFKFSTYAVYWIDQYIVSASIANKNLMHIPANILKDRRNIAAYSTQFLNTYGVLPSDDEISIALQMTKKRINAANQIIFDFISTDNSNGPDDDTAKIEYLKDEHELTPEEAADEKIKKDTVHSILNRLPMDQREVIKMSFGIDYDCPLSVSSIASSLNISTQKVKEIQKKAIKALRRPSNARPLRELVK